MPVVHDLVAHVDRGAVFLQGPFDGLDGAVHAGAVSARLGQQNRLPPERSDSRAGRTGPGIPMLTVGGMVSGYVPATRPPSRRLWAHGYSTVWGSSAGRRRGDGRRETLKLPQTILMYPVTVASTVAHIVMKVQQDIAELVTKGDSALENIFPPATSSRNGRRSTRTTADDGRRPRG